MCNVIVVPNEGVVFCGWEKKCRRGEVKYSSGGGGRGGRSPMGEKRDALPSREKRNLLKGRKAPRGEKRDNLREGRAEVLF